jgi:hypothetical protein
MKVKFDLILLAEGAAVLAVPLLPQLVSKRDIDMSSEINMAGFKVFMLKVSSSWVDSSRTFKRCSACLEKFWNMTYAY